jgi:hypothetical protein
MTRWHGHTTKTSAALLAILSDAQSGSTRFSYAERVLCTACEFWAAAMNHTLAQQLGSSPEAVLRNAEESFAAMGLSSVVTILAKGRSYLTTIKPPVPARQVAADLQTALNRLEEPVDDRIGQYAAEQIWSRLKTPDFAATVFSTGASGAGRMEQGGVRCNESTAAAAECKGSLHPAARESRPLCSLQRARQTLQARYGRHARILG